MALQAFTTPSLTLPRWQSNSPVFGVPSFVRLHEYKPQKTRCLRSMSKKKSSGNGAEDIKSLKWDTDDSKEERRSSAVIASEDYKKSQDGKPQQEDGSVEAMMKLLLVEAAVQKDMIAAQERMILDLQKKVVPSSELTTAQEQMTVDLQRTVSPSSELTDAKDQTILDLQKRVEQLEFNAAQQQMIADLQQKIAQLESGADFKSNTKTPPTEIHAKSKSKTETPPEKIHIQSESKTKTPPAENHVISDGETDEQRQKTSLVYFPASSDKEEPTGVNDDYAMAAMNALQKMQLDLNARSKYKTKALPTKKHASGDSKTKSKTKTPPTKNHTSGDSKTDEQHQRKSLVYFPASSDEEESTGVNDDYTMAAMKVLQRKQLDVNAESKSKTKTPPTENRVSGNGETDEQRQRTSSLVYFPASSDKEEPTGVNDDYAMAAMNALQKMQLDLNAKSKSKTKTLPTKKHASSDSKTKSKTKTPPTKNLTSGDSKTDEQHQRKSLVYFPASSDEEEPTGVNDDYASAAMNVLQKLDLNAESKSKTKIPPTVNRASGNGETDEQRQRTSLVYFPASSDEEESTGVNDDYAMAAMKALQRKQLDVNVESKSKTKTPPTENRASGNDETDEQRQRTSLVYFPASSDEEESTGVNDDYTMAAMKALQRKQLDVNAESKSKTKTPPTENRVSGNGETDEQRQRMSSLVYFPSSSDEEEATGVNDDYTMAAMKALQGKQLDLNAESKSKMGTSLKTPQTESHILSDDETDEEELSSDEEELSSDEEELSSDEEELSSDEDEQCEKSPLVSFSASSDGEEQSGFKDDNYTMAVMNVLRRTQMERNAKSKSKMETPLKTPQTEIQLSGGETDEEEHSSDIDEQSEEEHSTRYKDDEYTIAIRNQISKPYRRMMRFRRKTK